MKKLLMPSGVTDFKKLRSKGFYYVDKTGFIEELLNNRGEVNLIIRPRRFGKTLAMNTLAEFFDIVKESIEIFEGLEVMENAELCEEWMNKWPVLSLSLKGVEGGDFESAYKKLKDTIAVLCENHDYLETSPRVQAWDKEFLKRLKMREVEPEDMELALKALTRMMQAHHEKEVILLVDEYDVPLAKAHENGYYKEMLDLMRPLLGEAWKDNPSLEFAVATGCLKLSKESIFTGINNVSVSSVSSAIFQSRFGFTESEVKTLLHDAGLEDRLSDIKKKYKGYRFGWTDIYNPWDVVNCVKELINYPQTPLLNYWMDSSGNDVIKRFLDHLHIKFDDGFEKLLSGGTIQKLIYEDLTYDNAYLSEENLWSLLYMTGYLTQVQNGNHLLDGETEMTLKFPNEEIRTVFKRNVDSWFKNKLSGLDYREFA